jgi:hypothetical protein
MFNKLVNTLGIMCESSIQFASYLVLLSLQYYRTLTKDQILMKKKNNKNENQHNNTLLQHKILLIQMLPIHNNNNNNNKANKYNYNNNSSLNKIQIKQMKLAVISFMLSFHDANY